MSPLRQVWVNDPERFRAFYVGHMTAEGNAFVADVISRSIGSGVLYAARIDALVAASTTASYQTTTVMGARVGHGSLCGRSIRTTRA